MDFGKNTCPYELSLELMEEFILQASIKNISSKLQAFICDQYWNFTKIEVIGEDEKLVDWKNVYPPVTPPSPAYNFVKPGETKIVNSSQLEMLEGKCTFYWGKMQAYALDPGRYILQVKWTCSYGTRALYDKTSYEKDYFIKKELKNMWRGNVESNPIILIIGEEIRWENE